MELTERAWLRFFTKSLSGAFQRASAKEKVPVRGAIPNQASAFDSCSSTLLSLFQNSDKEAAFVRTEGVTNGGGIATCKVTAAECSHIPAAHAM